MMCILTNRQKTIEEDQLINKCLDFHSTCPNLPSSAPFPQSSSTEGLGQLPKNWQTFCSNIFLAKKKKNISTHINTKETCNLS